MSALRRCRGWATALRCHCRVGTVSLVRRSRADAPPQMCRNYVTDRPHPSCPSTPASRCGRRCLGLLEAVFDAPAAAACAPVPLTPGCRPVHAVPPCSASPVPAPDVTRRAGRAARAVQLVPRAGRTRWVYQPRAPGDQVSVSRHPGPPRGTAWPSPVSVAGSGAGQRLVQVRQRPPPSQELMRSRRCRAGCRRGPAAGVCDGCISTTAEPVAQTLPQGRDRAFNGCIRGAHQCAVDRTGRDRTAVSGVVYQPYGCVCL